MKRDETDEGFEQMMRCIIADAAADEATLNEVASSPRLWWGVQREIRKAAPAQAPSIAFRWLRALGFAAPVVAALVAAVLFTSFRPDVDPPEMAGPQQNDAMTTIRELPAPSEPAAQPSSSTPAAVPTVSVDTRKRSASIRTQAIKAGGVTPSRRRIAEPEIKSEFIALSYARDPESGQIVRVKVPNSMKVTLGLVASVEDPTRLTDAELLVGDDGLTRAIRFIR